MNYLFNDILHEVSKNPVIDNGNFTAASAIILRSALQGLNVARAGVWLLDNDYQSMHCELLIDQFNPSPSFTPPLTREKFPRYFSALDEERVITADDAQSDVAIREVLTGYSTNITSMLIAPIRHRGKMIGNVCCEHQGPARHWLHEEVFFISALAEIIGRAISAEQRNQYEQQLHEANQQLEINVKERTEWLEDALRNLTHTQAKLIESEKLASVGRLVSGLAHEINTPLGVAFTSASHCESEIHRLQTLYSQQGLDEDEFKRILNTLIDGSGLVSHNLNRAINLVQNFKLSGAIQTAAENEEFELSNCLEIIIRSLGPLLKQHSINYHIESVEPIYMNSYPGALAQIITNLVTNSIHHGFDDECAGAIDIQISLLSNDVQLIYSDNGRGVPQDIQDKIFEPFFTTARKTGGSGLGLAIVYNLVNQKLKGSIALESQPDNGAKFIITFPLSVKPAVA